MNGDVEILYNISAGLGFIAYLMSNVLWLRLLLVIGAGFYIATGFALDLHGMIAWHIGYAAINLGHIALLLLNSSPTVLPVKLRKVYSDGFATLKPREFQKLMRTNKPKTATGGRLLREGQGNDTLFLVIGGNAMVKKNGVSVASIGPGEFIGEMSVLTGEAASADVVVEEPVEFIYWQNKDLKKLEETNLKLYNGLMAAVGKDLVQKLKAITHASAVSSDMPSLALN